MTLSINLNGNEYNDFISAEVTVDMEAISRGFSFISSARKSGLLPIKPGDIVEVIADGKHKILTGIVDKKTFSYDSENHNISISGRSKTSILVDSTAPAFSADSIDFVDFCKNICSQFGIDVVNNAGDIKIIEDYIAPEIGQSAFEFIESIARKRQVLLTDDEEGRLVITRSTKDDAKYYFQNKISNSSGNNILSATGSIDQSLLFGFYIAQSDGDPISISDFNSIEEFIENVGIAKDRSINPLRVLEFYTEESTDSFTLEQRAIWEKNYRRGRSFNYVIDIQGHSNLESYWKVNTRYGIIDDFGQLDDSYLCKKCIYSYSVGNKSGSRTSMQFTIKDAFSLIESKDKILQEFEDS